MRGVVVLAALFDPRNGEKSLEQHLSQGLGRLLSLLMFTVYLCLLCLLVSGLHWTFTPTNPLPPWHSPRPLAARLRHRSMKLRRTLKNRKRSLVKVTALEHIQDFAKLITLSYFVFCSRIVHQMQVCFLC